MSVDVLNGYRRQVPSLPHSRAELGHHQGVSTQFIKEVVAGGQMVDAQDVRQDLAEGAHGWRHRVGATLLIHCSFRESGVSPFGQCTLHASSAQGWSTSG